jgi:hypothetical protein
MLLKAEQGSKGEGDRLWHNGSSFRQQNTDRVRRKRALADN